MNYFYSIRIQTEGIHAEPLSDALEFLEPLSISIESAQPDALLIERFLEDRPIWDHVFITLLFDENRDPQEIIAAIQKLDHVQKIETSTVENKVWETQWQEHFKPIHIHPKLSIYPSWIKPESTNASIIKLDPGLAFGTGTHPTTAMCLRQLCEHVQHNTTVIDYGCGSGVLAIAALKLGAQKAFATDIDPVALEVAQENATLNNIPKDTLELLLPEALPDIKADIIVANILANPLIELEPALRKHAHKNTLLILSGLLESQVKSIQDGYTQWNIDYAEQIDEWICLTGILK